MGTIRICLFLLLAVGAAALYEDQVGKFDWRVQSVGCPTQLELDRSANGKRENVLLTTKENAVAALSLATGRIAWRRLQSPNSTSSIPFTTTDDVMITITEDGRSLSAWEKRRGGLRWSMWIGDAANENVEVVAMGKTVVVLASPSITGLSIDEGRVEWKMDVPKSDWSSIVPITGASTRGSSSLSAPAATLLTAVNGEKVTLTPIDSTGPVKDESVSKSAPWFNKERCSISGGVLWCVSPGGELTALTATGRADAASLTAQSGTLSPLSIPSTVAVIAASETTVYRLQDGAIVKIVSIPGAVDAIGSTITVDDEGAIAVAQNVYELAIYETKTGKRVAKASLSSSSSDSTRAPLSSILLSRPVKATATEWQLVTVGTDCRVQHVVVDARKEADVDVEWSREEAFASISQVEMLDLPLSELQASIESEFEGGDVGVIGAFIRRITTQAHQLKRWMVQTGQQLVSLTSSLTLKQGTMSDIINAIRSRDGARGSGLRDTPLERDFFGMRRLIMLTTLQGVVLGVDNADGRIVWRLNLDEGGKGRFSPVRSQIGEDMVPIYVQRTTVHPGFNAIATVVYKDKVTEEGVFVSLDPMTGNVLYKKRTGPVKRVEMLPVVDDEHVHSLVVIEKSGRVSFNPALAQSLAEKMPPLHVMDVDVESGTLDGFVLHSAAGRLEKRWTANLGLEKEEKVVAIKGKPAGQRVHSRGRVLIDRNVHYKYINPNLVAIATLDETRQTFSLHLIDAVSGQVVHTGKAHKVSGPIHVVHCEHWVAYSHWSEKSRRTELGILELYEGYELPESNVFDSAIPTRRKPEAIAQSYVFSQGIQAMGVTETEQGLTTRSLVMALPFGGLFEVTRRFVDATRPAELTQEMREEMMIPYMPEIPIGTEDMVNYNQTVFGIRGIKAFPSGLESTSLVLAYGVDTFYTRLTPSGTFDILKDDFDHVLICLVLIALFGGSFICKRIVKRNSIKAAWA